MFTVNSGVRPRRSVSPRTSAHSGSDRPTGSATATTNPHIPRGNLTDHRLMGCPTGDVSYSTVSYSSRPLSTVITTLLSVLAGQELPAVCLLRGSAGQRLSGTRNGAEPLEFPDGTRRTFLEDGDEITITATAPGPRGSRLGFGEVTGRIMPRRKT